MKNKILCFLLCLTVLLGLVPVTARAATQITSVSLSGLRYPEAGKTCSSFNAFTTTTKGITFHDVVWFDRTEDRFMEDGDAFSANHQYSVEVWVEAADGYAFKCVDDRTPDITATIDGLEMEVAKAYEYKAFAMVTLTYYFPTIPPKGWLNSVNLTVPAPVAGQKPSYTQLQADHCASMNVYFSGKTDENMKNGVSWYTGSYDQLSPDTGIFKEETVYGVHTLLFPEEGYSFHDNTRVYVNGKLAEAMWDYGTFMSVRYKFPATGKNSHVHTPSEWRTTQVYHYKVCTTCGDMLEDEDHKGGTISCAAPAICSVCGYAYEEANEDHVPDTAWTACGVLYHAHLCTLCGAHCDPEEHRWSPRYHSVGAEGHAYQCADCKVYDVIYPHVPGPAGTPGAPETCKDCGYIIAPATDHTHTLTQVAEIAPTCTEPGVNAYYSCSGCNQKFRNADGTDPYISEEELVIPPQGHQISNGWGHNEQIHWRNCAVCNQQITETEMAHELQDGKCTTCDYDSTAPKETIPEPTQPQSPEDENGKLPWWTILLIGLGAVVAGVGVGVVLVLKKNKKKS